MTPLHLLVLRQDDAQRADLLGLLRGAGHHVVAADVPASAAEAIGAAEFDTMVLDLTWPGLDLQSLRRALASGENGEPGSLAAAERRHLALVLRYTSGNKRKAAHLLGISRSTLLNKVRKYGLDRAETPSP
jgi:DNA-binding NtrC family response regulator